MKKWEENKDKNDDQCISSRMLGSLGLGASGSVITCMHKKLLKKSIKTLMICMQDQSDWPECRGYPCFQWEWPWVGW